MEIKFPIGRIVQGHPMTQQAVKDDDGKPVPNSDGAPVKEVFFAVAYAKGPEADWKQTAWGASLVSAAKETWTNNEWQHPTFAWKVTDGDSTIPNKAGRIPNQREGFPGHWIVAFKTRLLDLPRCFHIGKYHPMQVIQNAAEIKCGDYVRVNATAEGNNKKTGTCKSPGIYINPVLVSVDRAGVAIVSDNVPDAATAFGDEVPTLPAGAQIDTGVQPDHEFVNGTTAPPPPVATTAPPPPVATTAPPPPAHVMLPAAGGLSYEAYIYAGWDDDKLIANGLMQA